VITCVLHTWRAEDQTGGQTIVYGQKTASALDNAHVQYGSDQERREYQQRLDCAAAIAERMRRHIYNKVGFVTTMGISVSPMLAKLASDLKVGSAVHPSLNYSFTKCCAVIQKCSHTWLLTNFFQKPNSLNILYPWRSGSLIPPMPLRKIPELGSGTLKALKRCLEHTHNGRSPDFWTCRDLVHVPRHAILEALAQVKSFEKSRYVGIQTATCTTKMS
jgi:nucleotidyltransferase/DNA polymerase involved in DNA repair